MQQSKALYHKGLLTHWSMLTQSQLTQVAFTARMDRVRTFHNMLKALAFAETAMFQVASEGIKVVVEEAKCVQVGAYITKSTHNFSEFRLNRTASETEAESEEEPLTFFINLKIIVEHLNMFSESGDSSCRLIKKGPGAPLVMILENACDDLTTECSIKTRQEMTMLELEIESENVECYVNFKGAELYGALNDLFRTALGAEQLEISVSRDSNIVFRALQATMVDSSCEIEVTSEIILNFNCRTPVRHKYRLSYIKKAMKTLAISGKVVLRIDRNGLLGLRSLIQVEKDDANSQNYIEYFILPSVDETL